MDVVRRLFLQGAGLVAAGLLSPLAALAATWNKEAFGAKTAADALKNIGALDFLDGALPYVKVNVKMGETSDVRVIVEANGKRYAASKNIKVTIGGCGG
jgi:sulfur-oxidizing protein SoxY